MYCGKFLILYDDSRQILLQHMGSMEDRRNSKCTSTAWNLSSAAPVYRLSVPALDGRSGLAKRVEAMQVVLAKKGGIAPGTTERASVVK